MIGFDVLFDEVSDGVCVSDGGGNVLYMNPAAKRMLEISDASKTTLNICVLLRGKLHQANSEPCAMDCPLLDPSSVENAVTILGRYGPRSVFEWKDFGVSRTDRWAHLRVRCTRAVGNFSGEGEEERHLTMIEDASAERELVRRREDWRRMVVHDLRSPLADVLAAVRALQELPEGAVLGPKEAELLAICARGCQRMAGPLEFFLDIAKLDEGVMPVMKEVVALGAVVAAVVAEQSAAAAAKRLSIEVRVPAGLLVEADPILLGRVIQNVLNNAVKFTPVDGKIELSAVRDADRIAFSVTDTGPGIQPDELPTVFERFRHPQARGERSQGSGLGLTFCREAVRAMGGEIEARLETGKGAEFVVRLPAAGAP